MSNKDTKIIDLIKDYPYLIIAILGLITYFQVVTFGFVNFDDDMQIKSNMENLSDISNLGEAFLTDSFFTKGGYYYRPMMNATFLLDTQISGESPWMHHTTALILHILTALTLFTVLRYLKYDKIPALFWASIFAISPVYSNAVAWLPARNDLLMGLFALLAFLNYLKYIDDGRITHYLLHIVCIMFAFMSKEIAFLLTIAFTFHIFLFRRRKLFSIRSFIVYGGWVVLLLIWLYLRSFSHTDGSTRFDPMGVNQFLINLPFIPEAIAKFFLPFFVTVMPTYTLHITAIGLLIMAGIIYYAIKNKDRRIKYVIFGAVFFFLFATPGLVFRYPTAKDYFEYFEARAYLPLMGIIFLCIELLPRSFYDLTKTTNKLVIAGIIIAMIGINSWKVHNYDNPLSFWKAAVIHNPDRALFNFHLARNLMRNDKQDVAEKFFLRALNLNPNIPEANFETGLYYFQKGDFQRSIPYFEKIIQKEKIYMRVMELQSFVKHSYNSLGAAYFNLGNNNKAIEYFTYYLSKWPNDIKIIDNLIKVYLTASMYEQAERLAIQFVTLGGDKKVLANVYNMWAGHYFQNNDNRKGLEKMNEALAISPENPLLLINKARMLIKAGDYSQAEKICNTVIAEKPDFNPAYKVLEDLYRNHKQNIKKADELDKKIKTLTNTE